MRWGWSKVECLTRICHESRGGPARAKASWRLSPVSVNHVDSGTYTRRAAFPCCRVVLRGVRPKPHNYPKCPRTLADFLLKRRLDRGLSQVKVARLLGVNSWTYGHWEVGLIRFRGHLRKEGYDVQHGVNEGRQANATAVH